MGLWTGPIGGYAEQSPAIADILIAKKINEINYQEGKQPDCTDKKAWIPISVPPIWTVWWCLLLNFSLLQFIHWHAMDEDAACLLWLLWGLNEVIYMKSLAQYLTMRRYTIKFIHYKESTKSHKAQQPE